MGAPLLAPGPTTPALFRLNRGSLQQLARMRLREARSLLDRGYNDGAYYLAGYAVECGLKACIAKATRRHDFPDRRIASASYTHDLPALIKVAGLEAELQAEIDRDRVFEQNWAIVKDWSEESRYQTTNRAKAHDLYWAIAGRQHGVMRWLRQRW